MLNRTEKTYVMLTGITVCGVSIGFWQLLKLTKDYSFRWKITLFDPKSVTFDFFI